MLNTINPQNLVISAIQWRALGPVWILALAVLISMLMASVHFGSGKLGKLPHLLFSCFALVVVIIYTCRNWSTQPIEIFNGAMVSDYFTSLFTVILTSATILVLLSSFSYLHRLHIHYSEFYPIVLVSCLGMIILVSANELLTLFVSLELMSLAVYVLVGLRRNNAYSNEAAVKYFVMGGAAAAIFLYGTAMIYGAVNTTKLAQISSILGQNGLVAAHNSILILGICLMLTGLLFKAAVFPFHMWTPDVYQGAPTPITSFMATALKATIFAAFVRVSVAFFGDHGVHFLGDVGRFVHAILWSLALLTMLVGNLVALMQPTMKRLMAYSAIAHTGYLLVGLLAGPTVGYAGVVLYLVAYIGMNIGAFAIFTMFVEDSNGDFNLDGLSGLESSFNNSRTNSKAFRGDFSFKSWRHSTYSRICR